MQNDAHDLEEVVLFPDMAPPLADEGPRSSDELLRSFEDVPLVALREWLTVQIAHVDGQMRKQASTPKPAGLTPELAAYLQARETQAGRKTMREAYMKAINKLDHYARQAGAGAE
jgi:hypothetical protein